MVKNWIFQRKNAKIAIFDGFLPLKTPRTCVHIVFRLEMKSLDLDTTFKPYLGFLNSPLQVDLASGMVCVSIFERIVERRRRSS